MTNQPEFPPFPPWPEPAVTGLVDADDQPIDFAPVPRRRNRRDGWTPETQRAFIAALEQCGCVARAARAVGMSSKGAYRLLGADGADSFAQAWDQAIARGVERVRGEAMTRALMGSWVPVVRRGRVVRMEFRYDNRLALALLSGRDGRSVCERRERAVSRRKHRQMIDALERQRDAERARADAIWAEHQAILDRLEAEQRDPAPMTVRCPPRISRI